MTPIEQAIEALEAACGNRCNAEYNPCQAREAIAALRAQPATGLQTAIRLVLEATPEQLPMAIEALRDHAQPADTNAPWLTKAHMLCTDHGVPQGHIEWRIDVLRELLAAQPDHSDMSMTALNAGLVAVAKCIGPQCTRKMNEAMMPFLTADALAGKAIGEAGE